MTEQGTRQEIEDLPDSDLQGLFHHEIEQLQETDPKVIARQIQGLTSALPQKDQTLVERALIFTQILYGDKKRRYSDTLSVLHPYRLALAGDTSAGYMMATRILHDVKENYNVSDEILERLYWDMNEGPERALVIKGVNALTRKRIDGKKEDYADYMRQLRNTATEDPRLAYLIDDKVSDMVQNCLDPVALPPHIVRRIPEGMEGRMTKMLDKYATGGSALLEKTDKRYAKLRGAMELCRRGQTNNLRLSRKAA